MLNKIFKYVYWALVVVSVVLAAIFFLNQAPELQTQLDAAADLSSELKVAEVESIASQWSGAVLNWGIVLFFIVAGITVMVGLYKFVTSMIQSRKGLITNLLSIGVIALVVILGFALASDAIPQMNVDKLDFEVTNQMSKRVGAVLYMTYLFLGFAVVGTVYTEVSKIWK